MNSKQCTQQTKQIFAFFFIFPSTSHRNPLLHRSPPHVCNISDFTAQLWPMNTLMPYYWIWTFQINWRMFPLLTAIRYYSMLAAMHLLDLPTKICSICSFLLNQLSGWSRKFLSYCTLSDFPLNFWYWWTISTQSNRIKMFLLKICIRNRCSFVICKRNHTNTKFSMLSPVNRIVHRVWSIAAVVRGNPNSHSSNLLLVNGISEVPVQEIQKSTSCNLLIKNN